MEPELRYKSYTARISVPVYKYTPPRFRPALSAMVRHMPEYAAFPVI